MRKGYNNSWVKNEDEVIAINLGWDFTAEHEWGINGLYSALGVHNDHKVLGIERYRVKNPYVPNVRLIEQSKSNAALVVMAAHELEWLDKRGGTLDSISDYLHLRKDEDLATAWSDGDLGIRVRKVANVKLLRKFYDAIINKEAAVWLGGGKVLGNSGLIIGLINEIPENNKKEMYDTHLDQKNLAEASESTGIKARMDAINQAFRDKLPVGRMTIEVPCGYYALKPAWSNLDRPSKYKVMYWLNPYDQEGNNWGWYTVEELELWIDGQGPVKKAS
jgi:hypothetical protein